jgi:putative OPT family oligopeptide transporter
MIVTTFRDAVKGMVESKGAAGMLRTERDMDIRVVLGAIVMIILAIWFIPAIPVGLLGAVLIVVFGFFFAAVSSRMVGLVGSSNNPVSGMAIATLLFTTICLKASGDSGVHGMQGAIAIGSVICIVACMAGDTSQDLKTGYILGATPQKQQIGEIIGTVAAALTIGGVLMLLDRAWGFGNEALAAPQATLMKMIVEGVMGGTLPWGLIFVGIFIAIVIEIMGVSVLPVAIGLYLPLELSTCIMIGGLVRLYVDKRKMDDESKRTQTVNKGILCCSGMIAGEGLVGILLAVFAVAGVDRVIDLSGVVNFGTAGGIVLLVLMVLVILKFSVWSKVNSGQ